jgi:hypothetical protein
MFSHDDVFCVMYHIKRMSGHTSLPYLSREYERSKHACTMLSHCIGTAGATVYFLSCVVIASRDTESMSDSPITVLHFSWPFVGLAYRTPAHRMFFVVDSCRAFARERHSTSRYRSSDSVMNLKS